MFKPVNKHLLIEPVKHDSFIATGQDTFEEIGIVLDVAEDIRGHIKAGDKVYFDSWLAAKYPNEDGFHWLVKWEHIRMTDDGK